VQIVINSSEKTPALIENVKPGEIFQYLDDYLIKTNSDTVEGPHCVRMKDGRMKLVPLATTVRKVMATLYVFTP
jgi:hypothetical protein